jgi:hypothetical protein
MDLSNWGSLYEIDAVGLYGRPCHKPKTGGLSGNLKKLLKNPIYNDLTFEVDGKEVPAHKAIVCSRSEVFETMFSIGMKESTINRFHPHVLSNRKLNPNIQSKMRTNGKVKMLPMG